MSRRVLHLDIKYLEHNKSEGARHFEVSIRVDTENIKLKLGITFHIKN